MICFSGPTCRIVVKSPDREVAWTSYCPHCGQRLLIPPPVQDQTLVGEPTPGSAATCSLPPSGSLPDWLPDVLRAEHAPPLRGTVDLPRMTDAVPGMIPPPRPGLTTTGPVNAVFLGPVVSRVEPVPARPSAVSKSA
jgi:hypothetical protein